MARAQLLAKSNSTREEEAAFIFHKFNESKSGQMDEDELLRCFGELGFSNGRQNKSDEDMRKWVRQELKKGDKAGNGKLSVCNAPTAKRSSHTSSFSRSVPFFPRSFPQMPRLDM